MARLEMASPGAATIGPRPSLFGLLLDRRVGLLVALGVSFGAGLLVATAMPRGPVTTAQALVVMAAGLGIGVLAGLLARSTWAILPALLVHLVAVEVGRLDAVGPTVDAIRLDSVYGILAFLLGRGVHGLLVALPMLLGTILGRDLGTAMVREDGLGFVGEPPRRSPLRRLPHLVLGVVVVALAVLVAWPASTPPVLDAAGNPVPGGVAELATIPVGGRDQTVMIRAADPEKPVLLYLAGGPGQSDLAIARALSTGWVQDFVYANWDQRGNGTSYSAFEPVADLTLEQAVRDTIEVSEYLRDRFGEQKIYLMGESWGTILGVLAVQARPDLYHAWLGSGQMVDVRETDRRIYADLRAYAAQQRDVDLAAQLDRIGEPPYADIPWSNALVMGWYDYLYKDYTPAATSVARSEAAGLGPWGMLGSEYAFIDKANVLRGLIDTFTVMYPQIQNVDFRRDVPRLEVPVYILDGAAELEGRRSLALEWFERLEAPSKQLVTYQDAAHSVAFEQADEVQRLLVETVVPATYGK